MTVVELVPNPRTSPPAATSNAAAPTRIALRPDGRDRYIDTLRALALVRVVTYHLVGWAWLPLLFPSMAVMFALAGGLVASSLSRANHWTMLHKRLRRLLPPLWALGAILVPLMLAHGWTYDSERYIGQPLTWTSLTNWVVPFYTPGASEWGAPLVVPLWYLTAYMWLLLLSAPLLWLWRRWPLRTMAVPLGIVVMFSTGALVSTGSRTDEICLNLGTFGACWMLGFAHHDGSLRRLPVRLILPLGLVLIALGLGYAHTYPNPEHGANIDAIPMANALYGLGYALLLLRFYPSFEWMRRRRLLDALIAAVNARAMTIYLWSNVAILSAIAIERRYGAALWYDSSDLGTRRAVQYVGVWLLIAVAVLAFGWVEDIAGKRRPRLLPRGGRGRTPRGRHRQDGTGDPADGRRTRGLPTPRSSPPREGLSRLTGTRCGRSCPKVEAATSAGRTGPVPPTEPAPAEKSRGRAEAT